MFLTAALSFRALINTLVGSMMVVKESFSDTTKEKYHELKLQDKVCYCMIML